MKKLLLLLLIIGITALQGCSTWRKFNNQEKGAVIGGGAGAVVGNAVAPGVGGTVIGGALGAVTGGLIGNERDKDKKRNQRY